MKERKDTKGGKVQGEKASKHTCTIVDEEG